MLQGMAMSDHHATYTKRVGFLQMEKEAEKLIYYLNFEILENRNRSV